MEELEASPLSNSNPLKEDFEAFYAREDPWSVRGSLRERDRIAKINSEFEHCRFTNGLDIGCGEGDLLQGLTFIEHKIGVDISERALATARRRFPSIEFQQGDLRDLDSLPRRQYDFISCMEALYYLNTDQERDEVVRAIRSLGIPHCVFLFSVVVIGENVHRRYFTLDSAFALLSSHFNVVNHFPTNLNLRSRVAQFRYRLRTPERRLAQLTRNNLHHAYQCAFVCTKRADEPSVLK
jgi:2-polyprenyl-3-methyl-5-hydroxy-6-metoxy-1,4-benzoquinol methylase